MSELAADALGWRVDDEPFHSVVLACPAAATARLLAATAPRISIARDDPCRRRRHRHVGNTGNRWPGRLLGLSGIWPKPKQHCHCRVIRVASGHIGRCRTQSCCVCRSDEMVSRCCISPLTWLCARRDGNAGDATNRTFVSRWRRVSPISPPPRNWSQRRHALPAGLARRRQLPRRAGLYPLGRRRGRHQQLRWVADATDRHGSAQAILASRPCCWSDAARDRWRSASRPLRWRTYCHHRPAVPTTMRPSTDHDWAAGAMPPDPQAIRHR